MQTLKPLASSSFTGVKPTLVFSHANGYPPETYRALLEPLVDTFDIYTIEHRPFWSDQQPPTYLPWNQYVADLISTLDAAEKGPVVLVGHSMGAVISMQTALVRPDLCSKLVVIDPVLVPWAWWFVNQALMRGLGRDFPMATKAQNRPHEFSGYQEAFDFYRSKRPFSGISDEVLWDYVRAGHASRDDGSIVLRWSGAWEACVYRSAPSFMRSLRKIHKPICGIVGDASSVVRPLVKRQWQRVMPQLELHTLEGGHLIPLEKPEACSELIKQFLLRGQ
jgi:pimeloyl-ACP methyl ester carboxylesterase